GRARDVTRSSAKATRDQIACTFYDLRNVAHRDTLLVRLRPLPVLRVIPQQALTRVNLRSIPRLLHDGELVGFGPGGVELQPQSRGQTRLPVDRVNACP